MKQASSVTLHFFAREKLNGFSGSSRPSHDTLPASESVVGAGSLAGARRWSGFDMTKGVDGVVWDMCGISSAPPDPQWVHVSLVEVQA